MPVALRLRSIEMETFLAALKGKDIEYKAEFNTIQLTSDNVYNIYDALDEHRRKKVAIKSKTVQNVEAAFNCQEINKKIDSLLFHFPARAVRLEAAEPPCK